jgi:cell division protein FtsB
LKEEEKVDRLVAAEDNLWRLKVVQAEVQCQTKHMAVVDKENMVLRCKVKDLDEAKETIVKDLNENQLHAEGFKQIL